MSAVTILQPLTLSDVEYCDNKDHLASRFNKWVADGTHAMTVLRDDGLYRHLRFRKPDRSEYWFDLLTWPGNLTITGDMGTYTFARVEDMFTFFTGYINTHYWAEKEKSRSRSELKEHDSDDFRAWLIQDFWDASRDMPATEARAWWEAIRAEVLDEGSFIDTSYREGCEEGLDAIAREDVAPEGHYEGAWECRWDRYPWHLELCMAAIVTGIRTYKATKEAEATK